MYTSLVKGLVEQGHEVRVIAPSFEGATRQSIEGGIPVLRVKSGPLFNTHIVVKGINTLLLDSRYTRAIRRFWSDWAMDWVLASTPPITLSPLLKKLKDQFNANIYLILRDIFPQNAKDLGLITNPLLFAYFRLRERHLYRMSDIIGCMSPRNIEFVHRQDSDICSAAKLTYFPNWIQPTSEVSHQKGGENFRSRFNLEGKFIALFGGNFGKPQQIEFILELAQRIQHLSDVVFFLIGDGTEKERIRKIAKLRDLNNVVICNRLPLQEYQSIINEADIGLVNLSENFTIPNIPSRTLGYWDASLPVLAATDTHTDLNENLLQKYSAGLWAKTGDLDGYLGQFMKLYKDQELRKTMGVNGRKAVESDFSSQAAVHRLLSQVQKHLR